MLGTSSLTRRCSMCPYGRRASRHPLSGCWHSVIDFVDYKTGQLGGLFGMPAEFQVLIGELKAGFALNSNFPKWIHDNNYKDGLRISINYFENISVVNGILTFSPAHMSLTEVMFAKCEQTMVPSNIIVSGFYNNSDVTCYMNVTQNGELYTGNINCIIFAVGI